MPMMTMSFTIRRNISLYLSSENSGDRMMRFLSLTISIDFVLYTNFAALFLVTRDQN